MKTRLGISVGLMGAALYLAGLVGGYVVLTLMVGYVLLVEPNPWLRKTAVKAFVVCILFSVVSTVFGFIPTVVNMLYDVISIFDVYPNLNVVYNLIDLVQSVINLARSILLLVLGFMAVGQGTIPLGPIDNMIHKHM